LKGHKMAKQSELYKVVSGNAFSQLGTKKIGEPVWVGPWFNYSSSKAHKVLPTSCSNTEDEVKEVTLLSRLDKFIKFSLLWDIFAFGAIMLGLIFILPFLFAALGVG
tara:strand:- start:1239 stop:1559 length:321 start_codon:yes stop_codon:yes gene_type:complete